MRDYTKNGQTRRLKLDQAVIVPGDMSLSRDNCPVTRKLANLTHLGERLPSSAVVVCRGVGG